MGGRGDGRGEWNNRIWNRCWGSRGGLMPRRQGAKEGKSRLTQEAQGTQKERKRRKGKTIVPVRRNYELDEYREWGGGRRGSLDRMTGFAGGTGWEIRGEENHERRDGGWEKKRYSCHSGHS